MPDVDGLGTVDIVHNPAASAVGHPIELLAAEVDPAIRAGQREDAVRIGRLLVGAVVLALDLHAHHAESQLGRLRYSGGQHGGIGCKYACDLLENARRSYAVLYGAFATADVAWI